MVLADALAHLGGARLPEPGEVLDEGNKVGWLAGSAGSSRVRSVGLEQNAVSRDPG